MQTFDEVIENRDQDRTQENANVDGRTPMGQMGLLGSEAARIFTKEKLLSKEVQKALEDNYIYIHDLDFYPTGTTTCCQIPLGKLLKNGFHTGHGFIRPAQSIASALALAAIIFQANQNMQHGGQAFPMFDADLAPYVRKSFQKHLDRLHRYHLHKAEEEIEKIAWSETEKETYQACEALIHNCNSMHSRGGGQVPFVSINYGTDTSFEGRMLMRCLLLATQAGLGSGETPIFPIQIFKLKKGINSEKEDPNYDLYQLALETTSKRLFPNFSFLDAPFNLQYYDGTHESETAYMGCRTRVMGNIHGEENAISRGNLSFTSINLVKIALTVSSEEDFFRKLDEIVELTIQQLLDRYMYQTQKQAVQFPFLYGQGIWKNGELLKPEDLLFDVLKQGTLTVGFIGLAEALKALTGKHHGESESSCELGLSIIQFLRRKTDQATHTHQLNFSLIASPAEGLSGKFIKEDKKQFGEIPGVTDRKYYTNSFHVPVYYPITAAEKIKKEAPFHAYCNGGHISYIELDGAASHNIQALDQIIKYMQQEGIGYGSINHPIDRCKVCHYQGIIGTECPNCHAALEKDFDRIRRITGYLVGDMAKWNSAKREEEHDRVKHG